MCSIRDFLTFSSHCFYLISFIAQIVLGNLICFFHCHKEHGFLFFFLAFFCASFLKVNDNYYDFTKGFTSRLTLLLQISH